MAKMSLSRSRSTPEMQHTRRNKLGYHRSSVACGHCRRRKIRCLITKEESAGRCSNCIRLKKECSFFPVESADRRARPPSKLDTPDGGSGSAASSPSPGLGQGQIPEYPTRHPASVPVTPISEPPNFEDSYQPGGAPEPPSHSASVSRRPSIAHLNSGPLGIKPEEAFASLGESVPGTPWEVPSQQEMPNLFGQYGGFEDPSKTYWQLNSSSICEGHYPQHSLHSVGSMASLNAPESLDSCDDRIYSQGPSRMGSIDQGMGSVFGYPASPEAADFGVAPDLSSASASTASLTASISEASRYGAPGEPGCGQHYNMGQWVDQTPNGARFDLEVMVKGEDVAMDARCLFAVGDEYSMGDVYPMNGDFHQLVYLGQHTRPKPDQE